MKLDKIKFAQLISYLTRIGTELSFNSVRDIDDIIDISVPEPVTFSIEKLNNLLNEMRDAKNDRFVNAIKAYRELTGMGLKESKEAVEKYR